MGSSNSQPKWKVRERETANARVFYLVFGEPGIRFVGPRRRGPVIFHHHVLQDEEEQKITRAETLQLPSALPPTQDFVVTPVVPGDTTQGFRLAFRVSADLVDDEDEDEEEEEEISVDGNSVAHGRDAASLPAQTEHPASRQPYRFPKQVTVYAGVQVAYLPGRGLELSKATKSQAQPVVLDTKRIASPMVETENPILLHQLCRTSYAEAEDGTEERPVSGLRRLEAAPLCIVTRIACDGAPKGEDSSDSDSGDDNNGDEETTESTRTPQNGAARDTDRDRVFLPVNGEESSVETTSQHSRDAPAQAAAASAPKKEEAQKHSRTATSHFAKGRSSFDVLLFTFLDFPDDAFVPKRQEDVVRQTSRKGSFLGFLGGASTTSVGAGDTAATPADDNASNRQGTQAASARPADEAKLEYKGRVVKQLMQVGPEVYELENIYDLGAPDVGDALAADEHGDAEGDNAHGGLAAEDDDEDARMCVICLCNPKDTTLLPCRHMCLCSDCAGQVQLSSNRCPICRTQISRVLTL